MKQLRKLGVLVIFITMFLVCFTGCDDVATKDLTVNFETNGGTFVNNGIVNQKEFIKSGDTIERPDNPTRKNYEFVAWYDNKKLEGEPFDFYDMSKLHKNITLYAKWKKLDKYNIRFVEPAKKEANDKVLFTVKKSKGEYFSKNDLEELVCDEEGYYYEKNWYVDRGLNDLANFNTKTQINNDFDIKDGVADKTITFYIRKKMKEYSVKFILSQQEYKLKEYKHSSPKGIPISDFKKEVDPPSKANYNSFVDHTDDKELKKYFDFFKGYVFQYWSYEKGNGEYLRFNNAGIAVDEKLKPIEDAETKNIINLKVTKNMVFKAIYKPIKYKITCLESNNSSNILKSIDVDYNSCISGSELPIIVPPIGEKLAYWEIKRDENNKFDVKDKVYGNLTIFPTFEDATYRILFKCGINEVIDDVTNNLLMATYSCGFEDVAAFEKICKNIYKYIILDENKNKAQYKFIGWKNNADNGNLLKLNENGKIIYNNNDFKPAKNMIFTPVFEIIDYNLNFDLNYENAPKIESISCNYKGTELPKLSQIERLGYDFLGWFEKVGQTERKIKNNDIFLSDKTIYAKWSLIEKTYNFYGYKSNESILTQKVNIESGITPEFKENVNELFQKYKSLNRFIQGYKFIGWFDGDLNFEDVIDKENKDYKEKLLSKNYNFRPKYDFVLYDINYVVDGKENLVKNQFSVKGCVGNFVKVPTKLGYDFSNWYYILNEKENYFDVDTSVAGKITDLDNDNNPTTTLTVYAKWTLTTYEVNLYANGGKFGDEKNGKSFLNIKGTKLGFDNDPKYKEPQRYFDGKTKYYEFLGWFTEKDGNNKVDPSSPIEYGPVAYYAHWKTNIYDIDIFFNDETYKLPNKGVAYELKGSVNGLIGKLPNKEQMIEEFKILNKDLAGLNDYVKNFENQTNGYKLIGWKIFDGENLVDLTDKTPILRDSKVVAQWEIINYHVTFNTNADGARFVGGKENGKLLLAYGNINGTGLYSADNIELNIGEPIRNGYVLVGWTFNEDNTETVNTDDKKLVYTTEELSTLPIKEDKSIYAKWEIIKVTVNYFESKEIPYQVDGKNLSIKQDFNDTFENVIYYDTQNNRKCVWRYGYGDFPLYAEGTKLNHDLPLIKNDNLNYSINVYMFWDIARLDIKINYYDNEEIIKVDEKDLSATQKYSSKFDDKKQEKTIDEIIKVSFWKIKDGSEDLLTSDTTLNTNFAPLVMKKDEKGNYYYELNVVAVWKKVDIKVNYYDNDEIIKVDEHDLSITQNYSSKFDDKKQEKIIEGIIKASNWKLKDGNELLTSETILNNKFIPLVMKKDENGKYFYELNVFAVWNKVDIKVNYYDNDEIIKVDEQDLSVKQKYSSKFDDKKQEKTVDEIIYVSDWKLKDGSEELLTSDTILNDNFAQLILKEDENGKHYYELNVVAVWEKVNIKVNYYDNDKIIKVDEQDLSVTQNYNSKFDDKKQEKTVDEIVKLSFWKIKDGSEELLTSDTILNDKSTTSVMKKDESGNYYYELNVVAVWEKVDIKVNYYDNDEIIKVDEQDLSVTQNYNSKFDDKKQEKTVDEIVYVSNWKLKDGSEELLTNDTMLNNNFTQLVMKKDKDGKHYYELNVVAVWEKKEK